VNCASSSTNDDAPKLTDYAGAMSIIAELADASKLLPGKPRVRSLGIVLSPMKMELQPVNNRQHKACIDCGQMPQRNRLVCTLGSGRSVQIEVRCEEHAANFLRLRMVDLARAVALLTDHHHKLPAKFSVRHGMV
jgi:hypothetical protein